MAQNPLVAREIEVLKTIVEDYIASAAPVGSRTVAKKSGLRLSPASMRNVMSDLCEKGYLEQPHTSAGRIPTTEAFRFYIDNSLKPRPLSGEKKKRIGENILSAGLDLPDMLGQASKLVSSFSRQVSLILAPSRDDARWREIDFALIKPGLVLAVLILDGGIVQNKLINAEKDLTSDDLVKFSNYLNEHFKGLTLNQARTRVMLELKGAKRRLRALYQRALTLAQSTFITPLERELFVEGAINILNHAEFSDLSKMRDILHILEERSRLLDLLDRTIAGQGVRITFCQDEEFDDLRECSFISATYGDEDQARGVVGVIGPLRMDYANVVPVVDYIARTLTHLLMNRF